MFEKGVQGNSILKIEYSGMGLATKCQTLITH